MTDEYTPDQPEPVIPPEVVVDDAKRPWKAYVSAAVSAVGAFVVYWVGDDDPFTKKDAGEAFLAALAVGAPGFGLTYVVRNPKAVKRVS